MVVGGCCGRHGSCCCCWSRWPCHSCTVSARNLGTIKLVFPQASITNYIEQNIFLCLQARLIGSSISTITWNELERNSVNSTKAITFGNNGRVHSCFHFYKVLFEVQILIKERNCLNNYNSYYLSYERPNIWHIL